LAKLPNGKFKDIVSALFDPNALRKIGRFRLEEKLVKVNPAAGGDYVVNINEHLGYRFFMDQQFDETIHLVAKQISLSENDILLDIGANVGVVSIPVALKTNCEVIAIEASPMNASLLLKNVSLNAVKFRVLNVCAVNRNLFEKSDYIKIYTKRGNSAANSIFQEWNKSQYESAHFELSKSTMLDQVLSDSDLKRIKLVKIDVEGAELEALQGFQKISAIDAPIIFEYRIDVMKRDLNDNGAELINLLRRNYRLWGLRKSQSNKIALIPFNPNLPVANAIGLPLQTISNFTSLFTFEE